MYGGGGVSTSFRTLHHKSCYKMQTYNSIAANFSTNKRSMFAMNLINIHGIMSVYSSAGTKLQLFRGCEGYCM